MMTNSLNSHNGGVNFLIRRGTYLRGGLFDTWRRELGTWSLGPCDICIKDDWVKEHTNGGW